MAELTTERYYAALEAATVGLAGAVHGADLTRQVVTCPEWDLRQLCEHVGVAHRWVAAMVTARATEPLSDQGLDDRDMPDDAAQRFAWLRSGATRLVEAVRDAGPETPVWVPGDDNPRPCRLWVRRMANETAVHRTDAEITLGLPVELAPELAADAISEWLDLLASPVAAARPELAGLRGDGQTLHLHATDGDLGRAGEWLVRRTPEGVTWEKGHGKGDVAVRAGALDLLLVIMRRRSPDTSGIEVIGDDALLRHWLEHSAF